ncbi:MAG: peptide deformylase [Opitutaceae bacterium]|nr:peptide deformylase [Cytophagales bacterium]
MIYPIVVYGDPVLKKKATNFSVEDKEKVAKIIADMFETMYNAHGVGLAAPQVGISKRLFVVDGEPLDEKECKGFKKVFINPVITSEYGKEWEFEEGCLSIPGLREFVSRPETLTILYLDENWNQHTQEFSGMKARIIQHEYDHIEGILFTDKLSGFKKRLIQGKLTKISKGETDANYRVKVYR